MEDYLLLKWGTIKAWNFENSPDALQALQEYSSLGMSWGAMTQKDTVRQKELICIMIDKVNGYVQNDWSGEIYEDKDDAKKYVLEYGTND